MVKSIAMTIGPQSTFDMKMKVGHVAMTTTSTTLHRPTTSRPTRNASTRVTADNTMTGIRMVETETPQVAKIGAKNAAFSVPMNSTSINGATFTLTGPGTTPVVGVVTYDAPSNTVTFTPSWRGGR